MIETTGERMFTLLQADARHIPLPDASVHCVVTSPPYWGLRSYLAADDPQKANELGAEKLHDCLGWATGQPCGECYVCHMVQVFHEVKRVLRPDGTCWANWGDSYNGSGGAGGDYCKGGAKEGQPKYPGRKVGSLKPKDLCMIPARVALALQADGWWLRSGAPWLKRSAMPESVTDRPASALEYVFLMTKSERYFYDAEAVRKPIAESTAKDGRLFNSEYKAARPERGYPGSASHASGLLQPSANGRNRRNTDWFYESLAIIQADTLGMITYDDGLPLAFDVNPSGYAGAHFATFSPLLVEPMVLSSTSARGVCPKCGAPWVRVVERTDQVDESAKGSRFDKGKTGVNGNGRVQEGERFVKVAAGWRPSCACDAGEPIPATVLDPFGGTQTVGRVANMHNRRYIGLDISAAYLHELAPARLEVQPYLMGADLGAAA